jgi:hypothetical protein
MAYTGNGRKDTDDIFGKSDKGLSEVKHAFFEFLILTFELYDAMKTER